MNTFRIIGYLFCVIATLNLNLFTQEAKADAIRLIVRGDDLGMTQGSVEAFEQAFAKGILTCASMQVPGPLFKAAADLYKKFPTKCYGIHLTLVAEWRGYRWRPILPYDKIPSLVDEDGYLHQSPAALIANSPKSSEIEAELRAQIELAKKKGIQISYLYDHYGAVSSCPNGVNILEKIAKEYNLPIASKVGESPARGIYTVPENAKLASAIQMLDELEPGLWLWVCHPGIDSPEQNSLIHFFPEHIMRGGGFGAHRAAVLDVLTNPGVTSTILRKRIVLTDYRDVAKKQPVSTKQM
jgi:predicted glycoside hydrolase/deacetylase ChbG (UPF0249 family)